MTQSASFEKNDGTSASTLGDYPANIIPVAHQFVNRAPQTYLAGRLSWPYSVNMPAPLYTYRVLHCKAGHNFSD